MKYYDSDDFQIPDARLTPEDDPLVVHRRPGFVSADLVVFVHGLGGSRYGTWGSFPKYVFDDFKQPGVDVGLYWYRTGIRRLGLVASIDLQREAAVFADVIRDLPSQYARVVIIAHSMGGLLTKAAVKSLIDRNERPALSRTAGLILMATPQAGSLRIPSFLAWLSRDFRALKPHGELVTATVETFTDRVSHEPIPGDADRFVIPAWAVVAPEDLWVDRLSAGMHIPSRRRKEVRGSHTRIVKPEHQTTDAYLFVKAAIAECVATSPRPTGVGIRVSPTRTRVPTPRRSGAVSAGSISRVDATAVFPSSSEAAPEELTQLAPSAPFPSGPSQTRLVREEAARPHIDEVLTIVTDPRDVAAAVFPGERNRGLDSQGSEYVSARQGIGNMRHELENRLRASAGKLLVTGPAGIGKTREVAELARDLCATNWKILVVKDEGDPRLGPLLDLPPALVDAKVLVVVDRLHYRIRTAGEQSIAPYAERLALFLGWLNDKLRGGVSVLATARDEPRYQPDLDLGRHQMTWRGFGVFRLPPLTDEGLHQLLMTLAARVNLAVSADEASRLIANSDRRPGTVVINIERAIQLGSRLKDEWRPTEGETWGLRLHSAREESAGVDQVWHAVHLLTEAGLPARANYVASVARALGVDNPEVAVAVLDGNALLGLESGVVTPHSPEQLSELIGALGAPHKSLTDVADHLERAIAEQPDRSTQAHDLLALATGLAAAGQPARGDQVATRAIELLTGGGELMESSLGTSQLARAYRTRAGIRFGLAHLAGVEADLSQVLAQSGEDADTYFLRAATRNLNNDFEGALLDLDAAIRLGRDNREVHEQRATAFYHLGRWSDVAASLGAAFERGTTSGSAWYILAVARMQLRDAAGAEQAFTSALERGVGLPSPKELAALQRAPLATPGDNERDAHGSDSIAYALRAVARAVLRKYEAAEQDVTAALEGGAAASLNSLQVALQGGSVPLIARAAALLEGFDTRRYEGALYQLRGRTRLAQGRLAEAVADFDEALAHGYTDGEVYVARAEARFRMGTPDAVAGAEEDASAAIAQGKAHAPTYLLRGLTRLARERFPEAEQDFDAAIDLSGETAPLLEWRGNARMRQQRLPDADSDFTRALEFGATATARFQRGCVRHDLGRYQEAEADLTAALGGGFSPPGLYTIRGLARLAQGNLAGAEEDVTAAFAAGAGDMYTYSLRGALRLEREQPADAVADFNEAIRLGRDDVAIHFERGRALHGLQRYAEAEQAFDTVIGLGGNDANVFTNRGRARWLQRKAALAEADFVAAIDLGRDDAPVHFSLGRARADLGRYREAELDLTRSLDREDAFYVRAERGRVRLLRGNAGAAEDDLTVALAASGPDPGACVNRALARYAQGRIADSLPDFDDALKLAPGALPILVHRVMAHVRLGNLDLAAADCERMAAAAEDDPDTIGAVGILRLGHADVVGAVDRFAQAAARDSSWHRWHGLGLLLSGSPEQAREAYRRETDAAPIDYAVSLAELDFYLEQLGDRVSPRPTPTVVADIRTELSKAATRDI